MFYLSNLSTIMNKMLYVCCLLVTLDLVAGKCRPIQPMQGFQLADMAGNFYLIAELKGGYSIQGLQEDCGYCQGFPLNGGKNWVLLIGYDQPAGHPSLTELLVTTKDNPAIYNVTDYMSGNRVNFRSVMIASKPNTYFVVQSCDNYSDKEAIWIYYYKQVQGLQNIDPQSLQAIESVLATNNICMNELVAVRQVNCTDPPVP